MHDNKLKRISTLIKLQGKEVILLTQKKGLLVGFYDIVLPNVFSFGLLDLTLVLGH